MLVLIFQLAVFHILCFDSQKERDSSSSSPAPESSVTAILRYSKAFVCSPGPGLIYLYEKTKEADYRKTKAIKIPVNPHSNHPLQAITTMCLSPSEETLAISTDQGQLYYVSLGSAEVIERQNAEFKFLSHSFHSAGITGLSVCSTKPLIATCSKDRTVHIWNYKTMFLEQFKEFEKEPLCVSMHPNGYSFLMGFSSEICLMYISNDNMRTVRTFPISNCTDCVFNNDGNKFAAIHENLIYVYNLRTLKKIDLIGHREKVQSVKWRGDDLCLVSCGMDGTVFVWDSLTGKYEVKNEMACSYADVTFSPNTKTVLAVDCNNLREISNKMILFEMGSYGKAITMTYSGKAIIIGTAAGTIKVIDYPFKKRKTWKEHQAHSGPVTKVAVTTADQYLVTASEDGSLLIWTIIDQDGHTPETVKEVDHPEEVLCTKATLAEKDQTIDELKSRVKWLKVERKFKMNEMDVDCNEKMNTMRQPYAQQIEDLKEQIQISNTVIETEKDSYQKTVAEMEENHPKALNDQDQTLSTGLLVEFEKHKETEEKMDLMQKNFEMNQQTADNDYLCAMNETNNVYQATLAKLQTEVDEEIRNSEETHQSIKDDANNEMMELSQSYEQEVDTDKESVLWVEHEMQLMEKKILTYWRMKNVTDSQCTKIANLKEEIYNLRSEYRHASKRLKNLNKEQKEQNKTIADQESTIEKLNQTLQNRKQCLKERDDELVRMVLDSKKADEESEQSGSGQHKEIKRLGKIMEEDKDMLTKIDAEMSLDKKQNQEIISDLRQKLKTKDNILDTVKQKLENGNILVERMKRDIHNCSHFIEDPWKLKEHFMALHMCFIHETLPQVTIGVDAEVAQKRIRHIDHFHKILEANNLVLSKQNSVEKAKNNRIKKECTFFTEQLKDQQLQHRELRTSLKEKNIEYDDTAEFPAIYVDSKPANQKLQKSSSEKTERKSSSPGSSLQSPPFNPPKKSK